MQYTKKTCKDATEKSYLGTRKVSGDGRYFRLEGLNDERVRNHVDPEGSGSMSPSPPPQIFFFTIQGSEIASEINFEPKQ